MENTFSPQAELPDHWRGNQVGSFGRIRVGHGVFSQSLFLVEFSPEYPLKRIRVNGKGIQSTEKNTHHLRLVYRIILDLFIFRQDIEKTFQ